MTRPRKKRLDVLIVERGLAESRERARALVMAGAVSVDSRPATKPGAVVAEDAAVEVRERLPYVSRGGLKLAHALDLFSISVEGRVAVDVGASTGGFTDALLQRGARRVYAIDVGYGQLDWRLRSDERVVVMDRTNIRYLERLPEPAELATVDVSFISLKLVMPAVKPLLEKGGEMITLVKPQFEAGRGNVERGGVVRDPDLHRQVLQDVGASAEGIDYCVAGLTASPILGPAGNREFLMLLRPKTPACEPVGRAIDHLFGVTEVG